MIKVGATPYISVFVAMSVYCTRVQYFKLHITTILCMLSDGYFVLLGENIHCINEKRYHYDVSTIYHRRNFHENKLIVQKNCCNVLERVN